MNVFSDLKVELLRVFLFENQLLQFPSQQVELLHLLNCFVFPINGHYCEETAVAQQKGQGVFLDQEFEQLQNSLNDDLVEADFGGGDSSQSLQHLHTDLVVVQLVFDADHQVLSQGLNEFQVVCLEVLFLQSVQKEDEDLLDLFSSEELVFELEKSFKNLENQFLGLMEGMIEQLLEVLNDVLNREMGEEGLVEVVQQKPQHANDY